MTDVAGLISSLPIASLGASVLVVWVVALQFLQHPFFYDEFIDNA